jgi:hypothetical protein
VGGGSSCSRRPAFHIPESNLTVAVTGQGDVRDRDWPTRPAAHLFYAQEKAEMEWLLEQEAAGEAGLELYLLRPPIAGCRYRWVTLEALRATLTSR